MATIKEVKTQIENANALGIKNLKEKGVGLFSSGIITTYDIMEAISLIIVGGGSAISYTNIVYNEDNTITLTDTDGVEHTMECEYTDGKLTSVKHDGTAIKLTYDNDVLVCVGATAVDMSNAPTSNESLDHTVTFMVDNEPYEVVSVKDGNGVSAPVEPTKEGHTFAGWKDSEGGVIVFPFTPTEDTVFSTTLSKHPYYGLVESVYKKAGVNYSDYPFMLIIYVPETFNSNKRAVGVVLCSQMRKVNTNYTSFEGNVCSGYNISNFTEPPTLTDLLMYAQQNISFNEGGSGIDSWYLPFTYTHCNQQPKSIASSTNLSIFDDGH